MRYVTHRGLGPDLGGFPAPEPVFLLRRRHARRAWDDERRPTDVGLVRGRMLPPAWPFANELDPFDRRLWDDDDDAYEDRWIARRSTTRSFVVRLVGFVTLIGVLFGGGAMLARPDVAHEALDWATLGNADAAVSAVRAFAGDR